MCDDHANQHVDNRKGASPMIVPVFIAGMATGGSAIVLLLAVTSTLWQRIQMRRLFRTYHDVPV